MNIQLLLKQAKLTTDVKGRFLTYLTLNLIVNTAYSSADKRVGLLLVRAVLDFRTVASESNTATSYEQLLHTTELVNSRRRSYIEHLRSGTW